MKLLPCARKISATSTVGRLTLPFLAGGSAWRRVLKWEEPPWGYSPPACDVERGEGKSSSLPNRRDRAEPGSFSDRFHVPVGASPNCGATSAETPSSLFLPGLPLHGRRTTLFSNRWVARGSYDRDWETSRSLAFSTSSRHATLPHALATMSRA